MNEVLSSTIGAKRPGRGAAFTPLRAATASTRNNESDRPASSTMKRPEGRAPSVLLAVLLCMLLAPAGAYAQTASGRVTPAVSGVTVYAGPAATNAVSVDQIPIELPASYELTDRSFLVNSSRIDFNNYNGHPIDNRKWPAAPNEYFAAVFTTTLTSGPGTPVSDGVLQTYLQAQGGTASLYIDGILIVTVTENSGSFSQTLTNGTHSIELRSLHGAGNFRLFFYASAFNGFNSPDITWPNPVRMRYYNLRDCPVAGSASVTTDDAGAFSFTNAPPLPLGSLVAVPVRTNLTFGPPNRVFQSGATNVDFLAVGGVQGQVTNRLGQPAPGVAVQATRQPPASTYEAPLHLPATASRQSAAAYGADAVNFQNRTDFANYFGVGLPSGDFGVSIEGRLEWSAVGEFTFELECDGAATLEIGGRLIIPDDGRQGLRTKQGRLTYSANEYRLWFRIVYLSGGNGNARLVLKAATVASGAAPAIVRYHTSPGVRVMDDLETRDPRDNPVFKFFNMGGPEFTFQTDASGRYDTRSRFRAAQSFTLGAAAPGMLFTPVTTNVVPAGTADFLAQAGVAGRITTAGAQGVPASVLMKNEGGTVLTTATADANGYYDTGLGFVHGANVVVQPVREGYSFSPATLTVPGTPAINVNFLLANSPPTISAIPDVTTSEDTPVSVNFTIGDAETPAAGLTVFARSGDVNLVPNEFFTASGADASRTLNITPASNAVGTNVVVVTVSDGTATSSTDFTLRVGGATNDPPTAGAYTGMRFDGVDDFLTVDNYGLLLPANEVTIEFWAKLNSASNQVLFSLDALNPLNAAVAEYRDGAFNWWFGGKNVSFNSSVLTNFPGGWHHFAFIASRAENRLRIVVDGVQRASGGSGFNLMNVAAPLYLGSPGVDPLNADLAEFRIWNTARAASEIKSTMTPPLTGNEGNLVVYYRLLEGSGLTVNDFAPAGGNTVARRGPAPDRTSGADFALQFDGVDDQVQIPNSPALNLSTMATFEAWVNPSVAKCATILSRGNGGGGADDDFIFQVGSEPISGVTANCGTMKLSLRRRNDWVSSAGFIPLDAWTHVAATLDSGVVKFYINGVLDRTVPAFHTSLANNNPLFLYIGRQGSVCNCNFFAGQMDNVRMWNVVRTPAQLQAGMNTLLTGTEAGLLLDFRFNEGLGVTAANSVPGAPAGTLVGGPTAAPAVLGQRSLTLDGVDDFGDLGAQGVVLGTNFTEEAWIFPTPGDNGLHGFLGNAPETVFGFWHAPSLWVFQQTKIFFGFGNGALWTPEATTNVLTLNQWNHVAFTFDGTTARVFVNGAKVHETLGFSGRVPFATPVKWIGRVDGYFPGQVDNVRIWNVTRTEAEIQAAMSSSLSGSEPGLLRNFDFEEDSGNAARSRPGGETATLLNGAAIGAPKSWVVRQDQGTLTQLTGPSPSLPAWLPDPQGFTRTLDVDAENPTTLYLPGFDFESFNLANPMNPGTYYDITVPPTNGILTQQVPVAPAQFIYKANSPFYSGPDSFTYVVWDGQHTAYATIQLRVTRLNVPPTISQIPHQTVRQGNILTMPFTVGDSDSPDLSTLDVSVSSSADFLVAASNVVFSGSGSSRFLTVTPNPDEAGTVTLTVKVLDRDGGSVNASFDLRVEPAPAYALLEVAPAAGYRSTGGAGINDRGAATGYLLDNGGAKRAFVFSGLESDASTAVLSPATLPGDSTSFAHAINAAGQITGGSGDVFGNGNGFLRSVVLVPIVVTNVIGGAFTNYVTNFTAAVSMRDLGVAVGGEGGVASEGRAVNAQGWVAGVVTIGPGQQRAFLFTNQPPAESLTPIGPVANFDYSSAAYGLSDAGHVVGVAFNAAGQSRAFLWQTNSLTTLPTLGGTSAVARAVNRFGHAVGSATDSRGAERAVIWRGGQISDLGAGDGSQARGINDFGQIVGVRFDTNSGSRAIYLSSGQWFDLNDIVSEELASAWRLTEANGINTRGEIIGNGLLNGSLTRAFVAEPGSVIGRPVLRPALAVRRLPEIELLDFKPGDTPQNAFLFSDATKKLYATRPVTARLKWPVTDSIFDTNRVIALSVNVWPRDPQIHVAESPAEIEPAVPGFAHRFQELRYTTTSDAGVDPNNKVFNATTRGYSVLYYLQTDGLQPNPSTHPPYFEVTRTVLWNDAPHFLNGQPADIGAPVTSAFHQDRPGRNGWIRFTKAFYDGSGADKAYDRAMRTGPILPVNKRSGRESLADPLVVVWYRTNSIGVAWGYKPVGYDPQWPANALQIVIASGQGSGVLDAQIYRAPIKLYNQPDTNLTGFNPNEEHALFGGGVLYAIRDDLNTIANLSDAYALLKHKDATGNWRITPFQVVRTNAQYQFVYPGTAGNEIQPLLPLTVLQLCAQSSAVSGPWWEDYNGKIYARAAGSGLNDTADIVVRWFYPLQPGFFYDFDRDGSPDASIGACLPLLGGLSGTPADARYVIGWPDAPVLQIGQTLVRANRGLPDILNFASADIVFDTTNPSLNDFLNSTVRMFDPLSPRTVKIPLLPASVLPGAAAFTLPPSIKTGRDSATGKLTFDDLPPDLASRLTYDANNKWLIWEGVLDTTSGVGEPLLLLNVMTSRERDRIKALDGDGAETAWDKVVNYLYDFTRNPNRVDMTAPPGPDQALRVGFTTNASGQVVLEQLAGPKALTAAWPSQPVPQFAPGNVANFTGGLDAAIAGSGVHLANGAFTIELWAQRSPIADQGQTVISGFDAGWWIGFYNDYFQFQINGQPFYVFHPNTDWHHWAVTVDAAGQLSIFRDGTLALEGTSGTLTNDTAYFSLGYGFAGQLDEVRVWNVARTPSEIRRDMRKHLTGIEPGLLRYFRFDDAPGTTTLTDSSAHRVNGSLNIATLTAPTGTARWGIAPRYVTIAENNNPELNQPVSLHVIRIDDGPFLGDLKIALSENVFDEKVSIRHSSDFAAEPDAIRFEWWYHPADDPSVRTSLPTQLVGSDVDQSTGWILYTGATPPTGEGVHYITVGDGGSSSLLTLGDNYFIMRFRGFNVNGDTNWSDWVGGPGGGAQLVEGWIKRVVRNINPFDQRIKDFHQAAPNTFASMLIEAGTRYEGDIAFNGDPARLDDFGLIDAYTTVLNRGKRLSIDSGFNFDPANNALLFIASRISDLYMLLGNEAYADASDPTIGFGIGSGEYGSAATSIFAFQNQMSSLLEEELALLRGRDDSGAAVRAQPVYNRISWNFTLGEGEVAYQQSFNIGDFNTDGFIDERDARIQYPQGHGDAWGHYLTAATTYYDLLRQTNFTWIPRAESILVAGAPVTVDYTDERKFARIAGAKAKAGAEIVHLTYRAKYVDDTAGQWQGYKDTDGDRAWGVTEWARRGAQGAIFDWVTCNALLYATDPNTNHTGVQKIDRQTVLDPGQIASHVSDIQKHLDNADIGLNPVGVAKGAVPFDVDPSQLLSPIPSERKSHFEQIQDRALASMNNALKVWDEANKFTSLLRRNQDDVDKFVPGIKDEEVDYKNRLIEIFGYPHAGDIGTGQTYPAGYDGPDTYHWMYVNTREISGDTAPPSANFVGFFKAMASSYNAYTFFPGGSHSFLRAFDPTNLSTSILTVNYPQAAADFTFVAPSEWGQRRAPGKIQEAISDLVQEEARLKQAMQNYDGLIRDIEDKLDLLEARHNLKRDIITVRSARLATVTAINTAMAVMKGVQVNLGRRARAIRDVAEATREGLPKVLGLANDPSFVARNIISVATSASAIGMEVVADNLEVAQNALDLSKDVVELSTDLGLEVLSQDYEVLQQVKEIQTQMRNEAVARIEVFNQVEIVNQTLGRFRSAVAEGERLLEELQVFRIHTAADVAEQRYEDMAFRLFRNDALQKYRAAFDLAARYVYLAANAYDYEVNFLGTDQRAGRDFLTEIIRQRTLGQIVGGVPVVGQGGLGDPMARLTANWAVLKGQFGINNPQITDARFSLRRELMRINGNGVATNALGVVSSENWRGELQKRVVPDLWQIPEFRRYCRPFAPESAGPQPGLVVRFPTTITFGLNFFGWPLSGGDSAYDPTQFSTKVNRAGIWFTGTDGNQLSQTPRVYLVPVGMDVMRSPTGNSLATREWRVIDQTVPVPFPIGQSALNDPDWIPQFDSVAGSFVDIRRFASFPAHHDQGYYSTAQTTPDSRLVGRSVWNSDWMLIIPGGTLLNDPHAGLDTLINTVDDIKIYFETYSYSGN